MRCSYLAKLRPSGPGVWNCRIPGAPNVCADTSVHDFSLCLQCAGETGTIRDPRAAVSCGSCFHFPEHRLYFFYVFILFFSICARSNFQYWFCFWCSIVFLGFLLCWILSLISIVVGIEKWANTCAKKCKRKSNTEKAAKTGSEKSKWRGKKAIKNASKKKHKTTMTPKNRMSGKAGSSKSFSSGWTRTKTERLKQWIMSFAVEWRYLFLENTQR